MTQLSLLESAVSAYASPTFPAPRPRQLTAHEAIRDGRRAKHKNQMVMAPTGSGKTYLGLNIIQNALVKGYKAVFVCDRNTLINQTSETADRYGLRAHGIIQSDHWRTNASMPFQIASAMTLARRGWPEADVIVIDEAHTQLEVWTKHIMNTQASVIGLSATPFSKGLGKLFTNLISAGTMHELTEAGVLVPMRVYSCKKANMEGAATSGGEWTDAGAAERGMEIVGDVVTEWVRYGEDRKTICFGSTVKHCEELCNQFVKAGIMAALYTGHTPDDERLRLLEEYKKPDSTLRILISVEALAKGFDVPDVGCIIDCRPFRKSLSAVIQMWGRGARSAPGKEDFILLDHSGNVQRFEEDFTNIYFNGLSSLDEGDKLDSTIRKEPPPDKPMKGCPKCGFKPFSSRCMRCGHEIVKADATEHQPGTMEQVTLGKDKKVIDKEHLYHQCLAYAKLNSKPEKMVARSRYLYKDIAGEWPTRGWENSAPDVQVSKEVRNKILSLNIARNKRRPSPGAEA